VTPGAGRRAPGAEWGIMVGGGGLKRRETPGTGAKNTEQPQPRCKFNKACQTRNYPYPGYTLRSRSGGTRVVVWTICPSSCVLVIATGRAAGDRLSDRRSPLAARSLVAFCWAFGPPRAQGCFCFSLSSLFSQG
jgi:hypothetical protein